MWLDELVKEHLVVKEALNYLLLAGGSSYILGLKEVIEDILPLWKEFKNIYIDSCHHRKEEILVEKISSAGHRPGFMVKEEHLILREEFKDVMSRYVSGDRGFGLASAIASYYEAMRRHINDEEDKLFKELLALIPKAGIEDSRVEEIFRGVERDLGEGAHEKIERKSRP
jgi:hemerythrin-like domain-containing protein